MNAQAEFTEVPLLALPETLPPPSAFSADDLPEEPTRRPDIIPCTFHGKGLTIEQWVIGKGFYDAACAWRLELGSEVPTTRFNRRVLAGFLRAYRGVPPLKHIPPYAKQAARAGVERAVQMLTGHVVKLRQRPKPILPEPEPADDGTLLLFH